MTRMFTARLSLAQYKALRAFAFVADVSMNEVVVRAVEAHLREHGADSTAIDALLEEQRARLHQAVRGLEAE